MNTGIRTRNDLIDLSDAVAVDDCAAGLDPANRPTSVTETAASLGKSVGVTSTSRITHAAVAAVCAHSVNRHLESDDPIP